MQQLTFQFEGYADSRHPVGAGAAKQPAHLKQSASRIRRAVTSPAVSRNAVAREVTARLKACELSIGWALKQANPSAALSRVVSNAMLYASASLSVCFAFGLIYLAAIIGG